MDVDILIEHAMIIDGFWQKPYKGSVAINGNTIEIVSSCRQGCNAKTIIDATGKYLIPGIIDMHSHSDLMVVKDEQFSHKIAMGITTEVIGNCGIGSFPATRENQLGSLNYDVLGGRQQFSSYEHYKESFYQAPPSTNIVALQAHAPLRLEVMKEHAQQKASDEEIRKMVDLLHKSFAQGVKGFSSGLYYDPCVYADERELLALLHVVKEHDEIFSVHHRQEGDGILESIQEVLRLAKISGVSLQISHLKAIGKNNQDKVLEVLSLIEKAHDEGLDVTFDQYPYEWGATSLSSLLPPKVLSLSQEERKVLLHSKEGRVVVRKAIENPNGFDSIIHLCGFDDITMLSYDADETVMGETITEIAQMWNTDVWDAFFSLINQTKHTALMSDITQSRESIERIMKHRLGFFSTDAIYSGNNFHRRSTHAVQDLFDIYYVEKEVLSIHNHIRRMCVLPAKRLKLKNRGMIQTGYIADLVLLDIPHTPMEKTHIETVLLGGKIAYENNKMTMDFRNEIL